MSSIGSGKTPAQQVSDLIFQSVVEDAAATAGPTDAESGEHLAKNSGKAKAKNAKVGAAASEAGGGAAAGAKGGAAPNDGSAGAKKLATGSAQNAAAPLALDAQAVRGEAPIGDAEGAGGPAPSNVAATDTVEQAPRPGGGRDLSRAAARDIALPSADQVAQSATGSLQQLGDVTGLAKDNDAALGRQKVQDALDVFTSTTKPSDAAFKKAVTDFADGMQAMGQGEQTASMLQNIFDATSTTPRQLGQKQALAQQAGVDLSAEEGQMAVATADVAGQGADPVTDAKAQLQADLASGTADADTIQADTRALQTAMQGAGQADKLYDTLTTLSQNASVSGKASVLAAAAALGIQPPGTMADAKDQGETAALQAKVQRSEAKAQQKAASAAAAEARSNATPSGNPASSMAASMGDISKLVANGGAVQGKFKMGIIPDYDNGSTGGAAGFISRTGVVPPKISGYVTAGADGSWDAGAADRWIADAVKNNVPTIELSVSSYGTGPLSAEQVSGIKAAVEKARAAGKEIDIRFGYEMNYGGGGATQGGRVTNNNNTSAFKQQWAQVAAVVNPDRASTPAARMIWSPNVWSGGDLPYADWLPDDPSTIDEVALDYYHKAGDAISVESISNVIDPVYAIAKGLNVPFTFGETGVSGGDGMGTEKTAWLNLLSSPELRDKYPLYQGFDWFDYIKGGTNFSISQDSSEASVFKSWYDKTFTGAPNAGSSTNATDDVGEPKN